MVLEQAQSTPVCQHQGKTKTPGGAVVGLLMNQEAALHLRTNNATATAHRLPHKDPHTHPPSRFFV